MDAPLVVVALGLLSGAVLGIGARLATGRALPLRVVLIVVWAALVLVLLSRLGRPGQLGTGIVLGGPLAYVAMTAVLLRRRDQRARL